MAYRPRPIDTSHVTLPPQIASLTELLAENTHEVWAAGRLAEGWTHGPERDERRRRHPCLVPYADLPESEKQFDRNTAIETLNVILALGFRIEKRNDADP